MAAKYAKEQGLRIGDEIKITAGGKEAAYLISGFTQTTNNLGKDCLLTRDGYERLGRLDNTSFMTAIVIGILILSLIIITFVLYLLVRTMLSNKQLDYGILKALGFTTGQLILLTALFLSGIGIVKSTFTIPGKQIAAAGVCLILSAFAITCLLSLRIRKIAPKDLLTGE